jgi:hypothetical protein
MLSTEEGSELLLKLIGDPRERAQAVERIRDVFRGMLEGGKLVNAAENDAQSEN